MWSPRHRCGIPGRPQRAQGELNFRDVQWGPRYGNRVLGVEARSQRCKQDPGVQEVMAGSLDEESQR